MAKEFDVDEFFDKAAKALANAGEKFEDWAARLAAEQQEAVAKPVWRTSGRAIFTEGGPMGTIRVGNMDSPELAEEIAALHNERVLRNAPKS